MNAVKSYYLPLAAWTAVLVIFAFVALPESPQPPALNIDKVRHAAAYALLGALAARAMAGAVRRGGTFSFVVAFFTVAVVGAGTEVIQIFVPGRSADIVDLGADLAGGVAGALAYLWACTGRPAETERNP
ncbi:MAG TPA: VanZ family protein [bacterium]|nr:VanZ family protein [bacterium]